MLCCPHRIRTTSIISLSWWKGAQLLRKNSFSSYDVHVQEIFVNWKITSSGSSLICAAHIVEIVAPTAGVIVLVVLAGLFLWWRNRGNNQDDEERRPLQQDGPGQDGAHRIPDAPPENMERRPPSVALPRSKNNNLSLTIWVLIVKGKGTF